MKNDIVCGDFPFCNSVLSGPKEEDGQMVCWVCGCIFEYDPISDESVCIRPGRRNPSVKNRHSQEWNQ